MDIIKRLPSDLVRNILLYVSHPCADLIKESVADTFIYYTPYSRTFSLRDPEYLRYYANLFFEDRRFRKLERALAMLCLEVTVGSRLYAVRKNVGLKDIDDDTDSDSDTAELDGDNWIDPAFFTDPAMFAHLAVL